MLEVLFIALFQVAAGEPAAPPPAAPEPAAAAEPADDPAPVDPTEPAAEPVVEEPVPPQMVTRTRRVCTSEDAFVGTRMARRRCRTVTETVPVTELQPGDQIVTEDARGEEG